MTANKNFVIKIVIIFIISILVLSLLFCGALLFVFFYLDPSYGLEDNEGINTSNAHQLNRYKKHTVEDYDEEITTGIVSLFEDLEGDDFLSYEINGEHTIISNFEVGNYKCTGTCFCSSNSMRKGVVSGHVLGKSFMYLIAAFTSVVAFQKAQDYFDDECKDRFQLECAPENAIMAEVNDCEDIEKSATTTENEEEVEEGKKGKSSKWFCDGLCEYIDCDVELQMERTYDCKLLRIGEFFSIETGVPPETHFLVQHLEPFCGKNPKDMCEADIKSIKCAPSTK